MANTRELRRRIRSIKNTSQITKAMQMVAATKMRRSQTQAFSGRPYNHTLNFSLSELLEKVDVTKSPLITAKEAGKIGIVLLSTDKSLCGALNTNLFREVQQFTKDQKELVFYTIGRKGRDFVVRSGKTLEADFENHEVVTFRQAHILASLLTKQFLNNELKEVYVFYPDFVSALRQEPKVVKLLPVDLSSELRIQNLENKRQSHSELTTQNSEFKFEPDLDSLLDYVLTHFVEVSLYQALLETKASEHSARMMAMQNATDNAKALAEDLTLSYNQTRQAGITSELLEITSAQSALE